MAKKKLRGSSIRVCMSKALVKKSSRTLGKHSGSSGSKSKSKSKSKTNSRGSDGDVVTYGVVPSEYNIQAQIDWLTAPPSEKTKSSAVSQPPPSKKPQRGFHRDVCEACGEGDCLIYCDKCPSAYHAICDDPPLPPEDYETIGINWKCKKCRIQAAGIDKLKMDFPKSQNEGPITKFFRQCLPFQIAQNPVQFKLSKEMPAYDYPFPGTSRHILKKGRQRTNVVDVENGMVPRPTVLCFHCKKSCRIGALIQCDKCDTFFHLDCLDPPLTTIPATVWLCPLHVEPYLESTQLTTVALSERIKIWDNSEKPVNRSAVILNFLRKGARRNPMFRRKIAIAMTPSIEIPEMVMNCYKENGDNDAYVKENFGKMQTLVAACEIERVKFSMEQEVHKYRTKWIDHYLPAGKQLVEQRARVDKLKSRNESKLEQIHQIVKKFDDHVEDIENSLPEPPPPPKPKLSDLMSGFFKDTTLTTDMENNADTPLSPIPCTSTAAKIESSDEAQKDEILNEDDSQPAPLPTNNIMCGEVPDWLLEDLKEAQTDINEDIKSLEALKNDVEHVGDILLQFPLTPEDYSKGIAEIMSSKGMKTSWNFDAPFAYEPTPSFKLTRPVTPPRFRPKESVPLQMDLIKSLPRKTVNKLAAFHLRRMRRKRELGNFFPPKNDVHKVSSTCSIPGPRPLISFHIENTGINIEITKRSFWVGSGNESDWKITDYVKCNRISDKHAKIFFNPHEQCWEILNYSPHGIYVNNTLFGFKGSEADSASAPPVSERFLELHEKSMKRLDDYILKHGSELKVHDPTPCFCKPFPIYAMTNIFEGSVKLAVGHRLRIGCAKLTIAKFATVND